MIPIGSKAAFVASRISRASCRGFAVNRLSAAPTPQLAESLMVSSLLDFTLSPETLLSPINPDTPEWLRNLVWTDFRLAVAFFVVSPLVLLAWSAVQCRPGKENGSAADAVLRIITGYWQASALLLITVLLNIGASPIGVVTGAVAQLMIWVSLNWWESLNEEAVATEDSLGQVFGIWRSVTSWVAGIGVAVQLPFLQCAVSSADVSSKLLSDPYCAAWLEPPKTAAYIAGIAPSIFVDQFATAALALYVGYLLYYVVFPLQAVGIRGRAVRPSFTFVDPLVWLGFLEQPLNDKDK